MACGGGGVGELWPLWLVMQAQIFTFTQFLGKADKLQARLRLPQSLRLSLLLLLGPCRAGASAVTGLAWAISICVINEI